MPTLQQIIKNPRRPKVRRSRTPDLEGAPQRKAVCRRVRTASPRKPNSADRKVAWVQLNNKKIVSAYLEGEKHNLAEHGAVLLRGGRCRDLPGVRYTCIRGKYDLGPTPGRQNARSKYGNVKKK